MAISYSSIIHFKTPGYLVLFYRILFGIMCIEFAVPDIRSLRDVKHFTAFMQQEQIIKQIGKSNAYLVWVMSMYLDEPDIEKITADCLTDGNDDKKIDFIYSDQESKRLVFSQGYYSEKNADSAPSNKASDLNTATAWLFSGDTKQVPKSLSEIIKESRESLRKGEIDNIDLLYVHNLPESTNVARELQTVKAHLNKILPANSGITVTVKELGIEAIAKLFSTQESSIEVLETVICPAEVKFEESGPDWQAAITSIPGVWLKDIFKEYGEKLFSANYRGFLGVTKRKKINSAIRTSAENEPEKFWVFNNGITILTLGYEVKKEKMLLKGLSIINGAQTTGSLGSVDSTKHDLRLVKVFARIIRCDNQDTIKQIVRFNNTQNEITTWDQYSNNPEQLRIEKEFQTLGHSYSLKRGFGQAVSGVGIEAVSQPLLAFSGAFVDANRGKNSIFDRKALYSKAFDGKKARHILFVYTLSRAIDERRIELRDRNRNKTLITIEETQLALVRNLRFKHFFMAVIGKVLEPIINKRVDLSTVAFSPEASTASKFTLIELTATWMPVVKTILPLVGTQITGDISEQLANENALVNISNQVAALIYASRENLPIHEFCKLVSDN